jgi:hypothetical protein
MNKKLTFIIICLFFYSCGFQPMLKNYDISKLNIKKINYSGKNDLNYLLKNFLNLEEKNNNKGIVINLSIAEATSAATKNTSGISTEEDLTIMITINIKNDQNNDLLTDTISETKRLSITNNMSTDEQTRNIEKNNLIRSLSQKIKFRIQTAVR